MPSNPTTIDFCTTHGACYSGMKWATEHHKTMADVWADPTLDLDWRIWIAVRRSVMSDKARRLFAVWCCRRPAVWAAMKDPRSRAAVDVAERFARGEGTDEERQAAGSAAADAAAATMRKSERAAQADYLSSLGNPFLQDV